MSLGRSFECVAHNLTSCLAMNERARKDKPVFGATSGTGLSGFRDNETGDVRAYVQFPNLQFL